MDEATRELVTSLLLPAAMALTALFWLIRPPKMGSVYGFRTSRTESNKEAWVFSHRLMAKYWLPVGILCGGIAVAIHRWIPLSGRLKTVLCVVVSAGGMVLAALQVNRRIRDKYPDPKGEKKDVN